MRILAFAGTRYSRRSGQPGGHAAPPYDQIDEHLRRTLQSDPLSFSRLTRPAGESPSHGHRLAATTHETWLGDGTLERDPKPSLYPIEIRTRGGSRRLGLTALVGIEEPTSPDIRPHEKTVAKTVHERLGLLRTTRIDLEPIFLLSDDHGALDPLLEDDVATLAPLAETTDSAGNLHVLYRVTEPGRIAAYRELFGLSRGIIADGHHRYEVARQYSAECEARLGVPASAKLAVVTSLASTELAIDPVHRLLGDGYDLSRIHHLAAHRRPWSKGDTENPGKAFAAAVADASQPAVGVWTPTDGPEVWQLTPESAPDSIPAEEASLAVGLLHGALLPGLGLSDSAATDGTIRYRSDPDDLAATLETEKAGLGFWLPPMAPSAFAEAVGTGKLLPPKSTRFLPKVVSGLVWAHHDAHVG